MAIRRPILAAALAAALLCPAAQAQRVIRIVVPFGPGAVQDTVARAISNELGQAMGASVIVENKAGAGGTLGTATVAKAAPDGNTLVLAAASHTLAGHLYAKLPYDPVKDFVGVAYLGTSGYVIAAPGNAGAQTLQDLLRDARARPGALNYASAGNGSATHLCTAGLAAKAGLQMQHIPMKSTGDAVNEVLAGRTQVVCSALIALTSFKGDARIKLLAYTGAKRSKFLPDLPTLAEAGLPGYTFDSWIGLLAPAALPRPELERLHAAMAKVMADPAVQERFARMGTETGTLGIDEFQKLLRADYDNAGLIVKAAGAKVD